jgi:5,10-methylenetetrahydromethanopterin reductase
VLDERFHRDVWVQLGQLAAVTDRLRLATCVTDPFIRHPALTASAIATLDESSGGRAILGLGAGASGFAALGIDRTQPALALREAIELMRLLWAADGPMDYEGRTTAFRGDRLLYPVPRSIPVHVAGRGPKILELAGEVADGVLVATFVDGPLLDHSLARVAAGESRRSSALGPLRRLAWVYVAVDEDGAAARRAVTRGVVVALFGSRQVLGDIGIELPDDLLAAVASMHYSFTPETLDRIAPLIPDELRDACSIAGTAEEVAARLRGLGDRGFDEIAIWPFPSEGGTMDDLVETLVERVIPLARDGGR